MSSHEGELENALFSIMKEFDCELPDMAELTKGLIHPIGWPKLVKRYDSLEECKHIRNQVRMRYQQFLDAEGEIALTKIKKFVSEFTGIPARDDLVYSITPRVFEAQLMVTIDFAESHPSGSGFNFYGHRSTFRNLLIAALDEKEDGDTNYLCIDPPQQNGSNQKVGEITKSFKQARDCMSFLKALEGSRKNMQKDQETKAYNKEIEKVCRWVIHRDDRVLHEDLEPTKDGDHYSVAFRRELDKPNLLRIEFFVSKNETQ